MNTLRWGHPSFRSRGDSRGVASRRGGVSTQDLVPLTPQLSKGSWAPMCPWSPEGPLQPDTGSQLWGLPQHMAAFVIHREDCGTPGAWQSPRAGRAVVHPKLVPNFIWNGGRGKRDGGMSHR